MKNRFSFILMVFMSIAGHAQDTTLMLTDEWFSPITHSINLSAKEGWLFKSGHNQQWSQAVWNTNEWERFKPAQLSAANADENGRLEGWFSFRFTVDEAVAERKLFFNKATYDAAVLFLDGQQINAWGTMGIDREGFQENSLQFSIPNFIALEAGRTYTLAIHFVDYLPRLSNKLKTDYLYRNEFITLNDEKKLLNDVKQNAYYSLWVGINALLSLLFWFLFFQNRSSVNLKLVAIVSTLWTGVMITEVLRTVEPSFIEFRIYHILNLIFFFAYNAILPLFFSQLFTGRVLLGLKFLAAGIFLVALINNLTIKSPFLLISAFVLSQLASFYLIIKNWKQLKGAQWAIVIGNVIVVLALIFFMVVVQVFGIQFDTRLATTLMVLALPLAMLGYVVIRFKEINEDIQFQSRQVVQMTEEKRALLANQNTLLENQVKARTEELNSSLEHLKATQTQLIHSGKMASLGELTAGIAHEIQNPLNFVNNFSQVSTELLQEMKEEMAEGNEREIEEIIDLLSQNIERINQHGSRASSIVKGMLQHSRTSKGEKEPTDINALCDEYLRLAYHGIRAKDKTFNVEMETSFDESLEKMNVIPQDVGRVVLNLITNAFYAVGERKKKEGDEYKPIVTVSTYKETERVLVEVKDNGTGIPKDKVDKIFQPFFTTKPTGQGTGLGLSLSYDIVKVHGGELTVKSEEGEGSAFLISLPVV